MDSSAAVAPLICRHVAHDASNASTQRRCAVHLNPWRRSETRGLRRWQSVLAPRWRNAGVPLERPRGREWRRPGPASMLRSHATSCEAIRKRESHDTETSLVALKATRQRHRGNVDSLYQTPLWAPWYVPSPKTGVPDDCLQHALVANRHRLATDVMRQNIHCRVPITATDSLLRDLVYQLLQVGAAFSSHIQTTQTQLHFEQSWSVTVLIFPKLLQHIVNPRVNCHVNGPIA